MVVIILPVARYTIMLPVRWLHHWHCGRHHDERANVDVLVAVFDTRESGIKDFKMQGSAAIQKNLGQLQAIIVSQILPHLTTKASVHSCRSWWPVTRCVQSPCPSFRGRRRLRRLADLSPASWPRRFAARRSAS